LEDYARLGGDISRVAASTLNNLHYVGRFYYTSQQHFSAIERRTVEMTVHAGLPFDGRDISSIPAMSGFVWDMTSSTNKRTSLPRVFEPVSRPRYDTTHYESSALEMSLQNYQPEEAIKESDIIV
jgi:hypothetical protein